MRAESRTVTITRILYIATDGTEFEDEMDCLDYEQDLIEKTLLIYNDKAKRVDSVDDAFFANLATDADVKKFKDACESRGITLKGIDKVGIYMYGFGDEWVNLDEAISHIRGGADNE